MKKTIFKIAVEVLFAVWILNTYPLFDMLEKGYNIWFGITMITDSMIFLVMSDYNFRQK